MVVTRSVDWDTFGVLNNKRQIIIFEGTDVHDMPIVQAESTDIDSAMSETSPTDGVNPDDVNEVDEDDAAPVPDQNPGLRCTASPADLTVEYQIRRKPDGEVAMEFTVSDLSETEVIFNSHRDQASASISVATKAYEESRDKTQNLAWRLAQTQQFLKSSTWFKAQVELITESAKTHPMVNTAGVSGDYFRILTKSIRAVDPQTSANTHDIGMMDIGFDLWAFLGEGRVNNLEMINQTYAEAIADGQYSGEAGHVNLGGAPCLGGWLVPISEFAIDRNVFAVIDQFIEFLCYPDGKDPWGSNYLEFPVVEA